MTKLLLIDLNSVGFTAFNASKLHAGAVETQAVFGSINILRRLLLTYPEARIVAFNDGQSWRKAVNTAYKANRDDNPKIAEMRDRYRRQKPYITKTFKTLGIRCVSADNLEADDMIAIMVHKLAGQTPALIISGDRDLIQLVGPNVGWHDPFKGRLVTEANFADETGYANPAAYVQAKALMGDASDNLKGVPGFGEKGAQLLLAEFGSVAQAITVARFGQELPAALSRWRKPLADLSSNRALLETFAANMKLMKLDPKLFPASVNMRADTPKFDRLAFEEVCAELSFHSILKKFDEWLEPFAARHPAENQS